MCIVTEDTCAHISYCLVMLLRINSTIITNVEVYHPNNQNLAQCHYYLK
jgi:hypothetical protein